MFLAWFVIQTALQNGHYKPSFLFILCLVAAFKIMRFPDESQAEDSQDQAYDVVSSPLDPEIASLPESSCARRRRGLRGLTAADHKFVRAGGWFALPVFLVDGSIIIIRRMRLAMA
jgi:hypothetical protein